MAKALFDRLALIGVGLIGSSIARAARAQGLGRRDRSHGAHRGDAPARLELGIADRVVDTNAAAVEGADLVILCIPVGQCGAAAREIAPHLAPGAIISDVGSVKAEVVRDMAPYLPAHTHFVPAHPVAGTEHSGPDAGFAELFINRWCILTPGENADAAAVERLAAFLAGFWRAGRHHVGRAPRPRARHNEPCAAPDRLHDRRHRRRSSAVTRSEVAAIFGRRIPRLHPHRGLGPRHVAGHFSRQQGRVLEMLRRFNTDLATLTRAIEKADGDTLFDLFTRTRAIRRGIVDIGQDAAAADFGRPHPSLPPIARPYAAQEE